MWPYIAIVHEGKKVCGLSLIQIPRVGEGIELDAMYLKGIDTSWPYFTVDTVIHNPSNKALKDLGFSIDSQGFNAIIRIS